MASCSCSIQEYERNWADIPTDLLSLILDKLVLIPDYIRFGAVCKSWQLVMSDQHEERSRSCHRQPPMLLIPAEDDDDIYHRRLYSICEQRIYPHSVQIPSQRKCRGSSHGWLAFGEKENSSLYIMLLNPFSGKTIRLPTIMEIPDTEQHCEDPGCGISKVKLSCDPCLYPEDWVAAAIIYGNYDHGVIAFIRSGESSWTYPSNQILSLVDLCFYQEQLYVVDDFGEVVAIDLIQIQGDARDDNTTGTKVNFYIMSPLPVMEEYAFVSNLIGLDEDLLLVTRIYPKVDNFDDLDAAVGFNVRKLSRKQPYDSSKTAEWVEVEDLGTLSLFVGINNTISVSASDFPNCKPNCIYFTNDLLQDPCDPVSGNHDDMGIFDLTTREISKYHHPELSLKLSYDSASTDESVGVEEEATFPLYQGDTELHSRSAPDFPNCKQNSIHRMDDCWEIYSPTYRLYSPTYRLYSPTYHWNDDVDILAGVGKISMPCTPKSSRRHVPSSIWVSPKLGPC